MLDDDKLLLESIRSNMAAGTSWSPAILSSLALAVLSTDVRRVWFEEWDGVGFSDPNCEG